MAKSKKKVVVKHAPKKKVPVPKPPVGKLAAKSGKKLDPELQTLKKQMAAHNNDDPAVSGKGVSAAIRASRDIADDLPENTPAAQRRDLKKAKDKATQAVLELPMTPEHVLVLKSTKLPEDVKVMRYHNSHQWASVLMWVTYREEKVPVPKKGEPPVHRVADVIHIIRQADDGGLMHEKLRPTSAMYFAEIIGGYPIVPAIYHFRKHADTLGATAEVRDLLGLPKEAPVQMTTEIVRDEGGRPIGEVKVPKPPKGGNSNKPAPNADLDELYTRAARLLDMKEKVLREKYGHLNNGLQAMNLRNRLKAKGHNV